MTDTNNKTAIIRELNDAFRKYGVGNGRIVTTSGFHDLSLETQRAVLTAIENYKDFNEGNDPNEEHDFGSVELDGNTIYWKIDYYSLDMENGSEDPANQQITKRVLTIMLAEEY